MPDASSRRKITCGELYNTDLLFIYIFKVNLTRANFLAILNPRPYALFILNSTAQKPMSRNFFERLQKSQLPQLKTQPKSPIRPQRLKFNDSQEDLDELFELFESSVKKGSNGPEKPRNMEILESQPERGFKMELGAGLSIGQNLGGEGSTSKNLFS